MRKVYIIILISALSGALRGQDIFEQDARFWFYLKLDKNLARKLNAQVIVQNRIDNNISRYGQLNGNAELSYRINKHFRPMAGYVYGKKQRMDLSYATRHQAYAGFIARKRFGRSVLAYRQLLQVQVVDMNRRKKSRPSYVDRNKFTVKYELNKRVELYLCEELNLPLFKKHAAFINRSRSFAGCQYNLSKNSYLEAYFLYQRKFGYKGWPKRDFIYGLTYSYSFI